MEMFSKKYLGMTSKRARTAKALTYAANCRIMAKKGGLDSRPSWIQYSREWLEYVKNLRNGILP
jgi:hypothetical protein